MPCQLTLDRVGRCGVSDNHAPNRRFFPFHRCFEARCASRESTIIRLNSAREITALWQQVHLRFPPLLSPSVNRHANEYREAHILQHTPVHKIYTQASKQAHRVTPALCFLACLFPHTNPPLLLHCWEKHTKHSATQIRT